MRRCCRPLEPWSPPKVPHPTLQKASVSALASSSSGNRIFFLFSSSLARVCLLFETLYGQFASVQPQNLKDAWLLLCISIAGWPSGTWEPKTTIIARTPYSNHGPDSISTFFLCHPLHRPETFYMSACLESRHQITVGALHYDFDVISNPPFGLVLPETPSRSLDFATVLVHIQVRTTPQTVIVTTKQAFFFSFSCQCTRRDK